jgi:hypothetical protein
MTTLATPLPWASAGRHVQMSAESSGPKLVTVSVESWRAMEYTQQDHAYIAHACNAYPKLVEALRDVAVHANPSIRKRAAALLRSLGEEL